MRRAGTLIATAGPDVMLKARRSQPRCLNAKIVDPASKTAAVLRATQCHRRQAWRRHAAARMAVLAEVKRVNALGRETRPRHAV
jgi:hypothetical protein